MLVVSAVNTEDKYNKKDWTITTDSEYSNNSATEGEVTKAFDGKSGYKVALRVAGGSRRDKREDFMTERRQVRVR